MVRKSNVVQVPFIDLIKLYILAVVEGVLCLFSLCFSELWKRKSSYDQHARENPPECLTSTSLGNHSYIKIKGVKFHYVESGNKDSPPLILLHGFPDSWISWRHQIPILAKHYRVVAVDLKGMGESDKPQSCNAFSVEKLSSELHSLILTFTSSARTSDSQDVHNKPKRTVIVAHGIGAVLVWHCLSNFALDERISKFVAIAAPHPNFYWSQTTSSCIFNSRWVGLCQIPLLAEFKCLSNDMAFINSCHSYLSTTNKKEAEILDAYKYLFSRFEDWKGAINYFRTLPLTRLKVSRKLRVVFPTLLIAGSEDPCIPLTAIVATTDFLENYRVKVVPATSHFPHLESSDMVNSILVDFLIEQSDTRRTSETSDSGNSLMLRMFGAVSSTVNSIQKRTTDIKTRAMSLRVPTG